MIKTRSLFISNSISPFSFCFQVSTLFSSGDVIDKKIWAHGSSQACSLEFRKHSLLPFFGLKNEEKKECDQGILKKQQYSSTLALVCKRGEICEDSILRVYNNFVFALNMRKIAKGWNVHRWKKASASPPDVLILTVRPIWLACPCVPITHRWIGQSNEIPNNMFLSYTYALKAGIYVF